MILFKKRYGKTVLTILSAVAIAVVVFFVPDRSAGLDDFHRLTKEDPLFASIEIECDKISAPIEEMRDLNDEILERTGFGANIVPVDFLESICVVDETQRSFLESGEAREAWSLISAYESAQESYEKEVRGLKERLDLLLVDNIPFVTISTFATEEMVLANLDLMMANATELKREISFRKDLLRGKRSYDFTELSISLPGIDDSVRELPELLEKSDLFYPREYVDLGPIYSAGSSCFGNSSGEDYFYVYRNLRNGKAVFGIKLATNNYYSRHDRNSELARHFGMAPEEGNVFIPTKETNIYNCRDIDYMMSILTMDLFLESYKDNPVFRPELIDDHPYPISAIMKSGTEVESTVLSREIPSERDFSILSEHYFNGYLALRDTTLYIDEADEMLKRYLTIKNRTKGLETILNTTLFLDLIKTSLDEGSSLDPVDLYAIRSNYPMAFLNFSPAVWRLDVKPEYGKPIEFLDMDREEIRFSRYDELVEIYGREKLMYWNERTDMPDWHGSTIEKLTN